MLGLNSIMCRGNHSEMKVKSLHMLNMYRHSACLLVQQLWREKKNSGLKTCCTVGGGGRVRLFGEMLRDTFVFNPNSIKYFRFGIFFFKIKQWGVVVWEDGVNQ